MKAEIPKNSVESLTRSLSLRGAIISGVFILFWLIPVLYTGTIEKPIRPLGNYLNNMYRIACLFPSSVSRWSNFYFQVKRTGSKEWLSVPESDYTTMRPFGYRSRLKRMYNTAFRYNSYAKHAMAEFVKQRYEMLYPYEVIDSVRFVKVTYMVGSEIATPEGHWEVPPLDSIAVDKWEITSKHGFNQIQ